MIQADTIVYEKSGVDACLAVLDGGQLREFPLQRGYGLALAGLAGFTQAV